MTLSFALAALGGCLTGFFDKLPDEGDGDGADDAPPADTAAPAQDTAPAEPATEPAEVEIIDLDVDCIGESIEVVVTAAAPLHRVDLFLLQVEVGVWAERHLLAEEPSAQQRAATLRPTASATGVRSGQSTLFRCYDGASDACDVAWLVVASDEAGNASGCAVFGALTGDVDLPPGVDCSLHTPDPYDDLDLLCPDSP